MPGARKRAVKAPIAKNIPITQFCKRVCRTHRPVTNVKVSRDERDVLHENLDSHGLQVRCDVPHSSEFFFVINEKNKPIKLY